MTPDELSSALRLHRLLAIVRGTEADAALHTVLELVRCGIPLVEVSLTTPDAFAVLAGAVQEAGPGAMIGAGTVLTGDEARRARDAGAAYIVTPASAEGERVAHELGLPVIAGALTPTEIVAAHQAGATAIKVFPASMHGGPSYIRALRDPLPRIPLIPVGGVDVEAAHAYLAAGALAVGVGSPLVGDAASGGSLELLRKRATAFIESVASVHR